MQLTPDVVVVLVALAVATFTLTLTALLASLAISDFRRAERARPGYMMDRGSLMASSVLLIASVVGLYGVWQSAHLLLLGRFW